MLRDVTVRDCQRCQMCPSLDTDARLVLPDPQDGVERACYASLLGVKSPFRVTTEPCRRRGIGGLHCSCSLHLGVSQTAKYLRSQRIGL
jgi:hypothetical protein